MVNTFTEKREPVKVKSGVENMETPVSVCSLFISCLSSMSALHSIGGCERNDGSIPDVHGKDQVGGESKDKDKYKDKISANIRMVVSPKIKIKITQ